MRFLRGLIGAAVVTTALVLPSTALGQIDSISVGDGRLGPDGTTVDVPIVVQCEPGWFIVGANVEVVQVSGHRIARGFGSVFPTTSIPCPGTVVVPVFNFGPFAFKNGRATTTGTVAVSDSSTGGVFVFGTFASEPFRIRK